MSNTEAENVGWSMTTFEYICDYIQRGKGPKYTEKNLFPVVNQKAIRWHGIEEEHLKYVDESQWGSWDKDRFIRQSDILWNSTGTGTIGRACYLTSEQAIKAKVVDSHVTIVRTKSLMSSKYVFYWIMHPDIQAKVSGLYTGSTNQVELSKAMVQAIEIPLPPLAEQQQIAAKLDELLAQVDSIKTRLDVIPKILKRFRQSVLAAAVSGNLTKEFRYENNLSIWKSTKLHKLANILDPHPSHRTPKEVQGGIPYIGIGDLKKDGSIDFENARKVSNDILFEHQNRYKLDFGDFVFGKIGTLGKATELPINVEYTLSANVILIQPNKEITTPKYLMYFLSSPSTMTDIAKQANSTSQAAFGIKKMREFICEIPSFEEQTEIVRRVEQLFTYADQIEQRVKDAQTHVNHLTQAILAKAFRGELTAEWRTQNPDLISGENSAETLLVKIKAERTTKQTGRKARV